MRQIWAHKTAVLQSWFNHLPKNFPKEAESLDHVRPIRIALCHPSDVEGWWENHTLVSASQMIKEAESPHFPIASLVLNAAWLNLRISATGSHQRHKQGSWVPGAVAAHESSDFHLPVLLMQLHGYGSNCYFCSPHLSWYPQLPWSPCLSYSTGSQLLNWDCQPTGEGNRAGKGGQQNLRQAGVPAPAATTSPSGLCMPVLDRGA